MVLPTFQIASSAFLLFSPLKTTGQVGRNMWPSFQFADEDMTSRGACSSLRSHSKEITEPEPEFKTLPSGLGRYGVLVGSSRWESPEMWMNESHVKANGKAMVKGKIAAETHEQATMGRTKGGEMNIKIINKCIKHSRRAPLAEWRKQWISGLKRSTYAL